MRIKTWLCWIRHKWQCKEVHRIAQVRYIRRCLRCGWFEVSREPITRSRGTHMLPTLQELKRQVVKKRNLLTIFLRK